MVFRRRAGPRFWSFTKHTPSSYTKLPKLPTRRQIDPATSIHTDKDPSPRAKDLQASQNSSQQCSTMAPTVKLLSITQMIIHCLAAFIALVVTGIAGHILLVTDQHHGDKYMIEWVGGIMFLKYLPVHWSLTRPIVLCITGVLCLVANAVVAGLLVRGQTTSSKSAAAKVNPSLNRRYYVLIASIVPTVARIHSYERQSSALDDRCDCLCKCSLPETSVRSCTHQSLTLTLHQAWQHTFVSVNNTDFMLKSRPNNDSNFNPLPEWTSSWSYGYESLEGPRHTPPTYDPISWNCALAPMVIGPNDRKHLPPVNIGAKARVHGMCQEGKC